MVILVRHCYVKRQGGCSFGRFKLQLVTYRLVPVPIYCYVALDIYLRLHAVTQEAHFFSFPTLWEANNT